MRRTPTRRARRRRGFSLMELLIAIAILLAIGAIVLVNFAPLKDNADIDLTRAQIDNFQNGLKLFKLNVGRYPSEEEGLKVLWSKAALEDEELDGPKWRGPYLETPSPKDAWGSEWVYTYPSEEREDMYKIVSLGPDREESDDDITSFDRFMDEDGELTEDFDDFGAADEGSGAG